MQWSRGTTANHLGRGITVERSSLMWQILLSIVNVSPGDCVMGALITIIIRCEVAERLIAKGINLELLPSHQAVGNPEVDNQLDRFYESYCKSLAHLCT